ncbi:MAG: hypothetical protein A3F67_05250 [Verrucomicrobia bacterium RIFCSPHIGHO2_12_FULL_41_10]|nr:MAG: hypothetical protein A3F67_05250 [Verrucomicrobia bacterium RIFCSPHIGHO2_12_FULL_41_10]HLB34465.1 hypothetical protein [Chthoniobacterales bacterium]
MLTLRTSRFSLLTLLFLGIVTSFSSLHATVDDALSFAYEAALPYYKQYAIRKDAWGGDLGPGDKQAITTQLFKGNDYWFLMASDVPKASISVHLYDSNGKLVESESWQKMNEKKHFSSAGAHIIPKSTGTYFAIVQIIRSPEERTHWALVYGYKDVK